jgi:hypothetical protein
MGFAGDLLSMGNAAPPITRLREEQHCSHNGSFYTASVVPTSGVCVKHRGKEVCCIQLDSPRSIFWFTMLLLMCLPISGSSSDAQGNDVALGFGLESYQTFLQARSNRLDLPYRHWLSGYLTP